MKNSSKLLLFGLTLCAFLAGIFFFTEKNQNTSSESEKRDVSSLPPGGAIDPTQDLQTPLEEELAREGKKEESNSDETKGAPSQSDEHAQVNTPKTPGTTAAPEVAKVVKPKVPDCEEKRFVRVDSKEAKSMKKKLRYAKNVLSLSEEPIHAKSVCVKVDGVPVEYKWEDKKRTQISLAPIPKSDAVITVRYCHKNALCPVKCDIPKDEFMEVLGGKKTAELFKGIDAETVKWDNSVQDDSEMTRELASVFAQVDPDKIEKKTVNKFWEIKQQKSVCVKE